MEWDKFKKFIIVEYGIDSVIRNIKTIPNQDMDT